MLPAFHQFNPLARKLLVRLQASPKAGDLMGAQGQKFRGLANRFTKAEIGAVTEADWARIGELLRRSWRSLSQAVRS